MVHAFASIACIEYSMEAEAGYQDSTMALSSFPQRS
jgi:hypothetical protein